MTDPIAFAAIGLVIALLVFGAYQFGFTHGLSSGFKQGLYCAQDFARLKHSESTQLNGKQRL